MLSKIYSSATYGIDAYLVEVETNVEQQIPGFTIVGLPDNAVKESKERVITAIKTVDINFRLKGLQLILHQLILKKKAAPLIYLSQLEFYPQMKL